MTPTELVQRQFDAYNAQDLEALCNTYAVDCVIAALNGAVTQSGREEVRARYGKLFADYPGNRAVLVNRMALGDVVIDHEDVTRGPNGPRLQAIAIYTVKNGLIARVDFVK